MATIVTKRLLAQKQPTQTGVTVLYQNPSNTQTDIRKIIVANTSGTAATYSVYFSSTSDSFSDLNALYASSPVPANQSITIDFGAYGLPMRLATEYLGCQASVANEITFSVFGEQIVET